MTVTYCLEVWIESARVEPTLLFRAQSAVPLPALGVGQSFEPAEWQQLLRWSPFEEFGQAQHGLDGQSALPKFIVTADSSRYVRHGTLVERVRELWIAADGDAPLSELEQAEARIVLERTHTAFWYEVLSEVSPLAERGAFQGCVDGVVAALKSDKPKLREGDAKTAWAEAACILGADDHLLAQQVRDDILSLASHQIRQLSRGERLALWLQREPDGNSQGVEMLLADWDAKKLMAFDPATANPGCMDETENAIQDEVVAALLNAVDAGR